MAEIKAKVAAEEAEHGKGQGGGFSSFRRPPTGLSRRRR